jgi:hypothetical protein
MPAPEAERSVRKPPGFQHNPTSMLRFTAAVESYQPLLLTPYVNGNRLASGTGFVVDSTKGPLLVTCRHIVTGRNNDTGTPLSSTGAVPSALIVRHNGYPDPVTGIDTTVEHLHQLYDGERPLWVEHPLLGPRADVVALPLDSDPRARLFPVNQKPTDLALRLALRPGEPVSVIGYPFGRDGPGNLPIWMTGFIASEIVLPYNGLPAFLIDCRTRSGQSGSPVFAYRFGSAVVNRLNNSGVDIVLFDDVLSRFLGVYSGRIRDDADIGIVWKSDVVNDLICAVELRDSAS